MSYELCHDVYPSPPCPEYRDGYHLHEWAASSPYPLTCVYSPRQVASVFFGSISILFWMMVTIPQIIVNYRLKRAESLSVFFLLQWFAGDTANAIGCFLTKQTPAQTYLALYYVSQDVCLFGQYLYYKHYGPKSSLPFDVDCEGGIDSLATAKERCVSPAETGEGPARSPNRSPNGPSILDSFLSSGSTPRSQPRSFVSRSGSYVLQASPSPTPSPFEGYRARSAKLGSGRTALSVPISINERSSASGSGVSPPSDVSRESSASLTGSKALRATVLLLGVSMLLFLPHTEPLRRPSDLPAAPRGGSRRLLSEQHAVEPQIDVSKLDRPHHHHDEAPEDPLHEAPQEPSHKPKDEAAEKKYYIGIVVGWFSAALYLGSRVPQLVLNFRRGSTDGLSPLMFTMAVLGNTTYSLGILLLDSSGSSCLCHLPWLIGALGTVQFDMMALFQFLWYRSKNVAREELEKEEAKEAMRKMLDTIDDNAIRSVPLVLPHTVCGGAIRRGYYGRIGIWYNE
eukprot:Sspe_Gene.19562::Locus_7139_Transcript_1_1_Confidence_1.000_Length_1636::g.19562::m.19562